jgi:carbon storage regulator CsrA
VVVGASTDSVPLLTVTVLEVAGGRVRLGFEAGRDMLVHRREVWEQIRAAGRTDGRAAPGG